MHQQLRQSARTSAYTRHEGPHICAHHTKRAHSAHTRRNAAYVHIVDTRSTHLHTLNTACSSAHTSNGAQIAHRRHKRCSCADARQKTHNLHLLARALHIAHILDMRCCAEKGLGSVVRGTDGGRDRVTVRGSVLHFGGAREMHRLLRFLF